MLAYRDIKETLILKVNCFKGDANSTIAKKNCITCWFFFLMQYQQLSK